MYTPISTLPNVTLKRYKFRIHLLAIVAQTRTPPAISLGNVVDKIALRIRRDRTETIRHKPRFGVMQRIAVTVPPLPNTAFWYSPPTTRNGCVVDHGPEINFRAEPHAVTVLQFLVVTLE